eukprot:s825_g3.t1
MAIFNSYVSLPEGRGNHHFLLDNCPAQSDPQDAVHLLIREGIKRLQEGSCSEESAADSTFCQIELPVTAMAREKSSKFQVAGSGSASRTFQGQKRLGKLFRQRSEATDI